MISDIHGGIHGEQKEADPKGVCTTQKLGVGAHDQGKRFAVPELVVTPTLEPAKNRVETFLRMALELAKNCDVAGVTDFFGQVGRIKNIFWLEIGVCLGALEVAHVNAQAKIFQRLVDKARMARLVPSHVAHQRLDIRVVHIFVDFVVEDAARKFRGQRTDQEIKELLPELRGHFGEGFRDLDRELRGALEVVMVVVALVLGQHGVPLRTQGRDIEPVHGIKVGGVETWAQQRVFFGLEGNGFNGFGGCAGLHHVFLFVWRTNLPVSWREMG